MARSEPWSFEDEVLNDMTEEQIRRIPRNCEHSVAGCIWHMARIEDVAMNMLVAGRPQVLYRENWLEPLNASVQHTGNAMDVAGLDMVIVTTADPLHDMWAGGDPWKYEGAINRLVGRFIRSLPRE